MLDGATAFALPTKFGQFLKVESGFKDIVYWKSFDFDQSCWFETQIAFDAICDKKIVNKDQNIKNTLVAILQAAHRLNPNVLLNASGFDITTTLTFPRNWGLGTSSTLINNIAQWFQIDAFELLKNSFGGSGYDIACAQNNTPILYQLQKGSPTITQVSFCPSFTKYIYFVYSNQKQNSKTAIENYRKNNCKTPAALYKIAHLTNTIATATNFKTFEKAIQEHETEMSLLLNQPTVQQQLFADFNGTIKSLGAWGGEFVMVISTENPRNYFELKGFNTVLSYAEMIL